MSQIRIDAVSIPKTSFTKEGYVKGEAIVTRAGVFEYMNCDGSIRRELRHPDDVFKQDSLESLKTIPITVDHPHVLVTAENTSDLMVGMTGETVKLDKEHILTSINVTHKNGIEAINKGKRALSLGYTVDLIKEDGTFNGESYTHRQTNIKYNHLAIVNKGRAGKEARINFDSFSDDSIAVQVQQSKTNLINNERKKMNEDEIKSLNIKLDQLEKELFAEKKIRADKESEHDKLQARFDELKLENEKLKATRTDSLINEKVRKRVELFAKASKVLKLDTIDELTDRQIMEKVIMNRDSSKDLSQYSDDYISGRFDTIIENLGDSSAIANQMKALDVKVDHAQNRISTMRIMQSANLKKRGE